MPAPLKSTHRRDAQGLWSGFGHSMEGVPVPKPFTVRWGRSSLCSPKQRTSTSISLDSSRLR